MAFSRYYHVSPPETVDRIVGITESNTTKAWYRDSRSDDASGVVKANVVTKSSLAVLA